MRCVLCGESETVFFETHFHPLPISRFYWWELNLKKRGEKRYKNTSRQGTTKMVIRFLTCPSLDGSSLFPRKERERGSLYFSAIYYPKDSFLQLKNGAVQSNSFPRFFSRSDRRTLKESKIMAARGHVFRRRRFQHTKNFWKNLFFIFFLFLSFRALEPPCRFSFGLRAPLFFSRPLAELDRLVAWRQWDLTSATTTSRRAYYPAGDLWLAVYTLRSAGAPSVFE